MKSVPICSNGASLPGPIGMFRGSSSKHSFGYSAASFQQPYDGRRTNPGLGSSSRTSRCERSAGKQCGAVPENASKPVRGAFPAAQVRSDNAPLGSSTCRTRIDRHPSPVGIYPRPSRPRHMATDGVLFADPTEGHRFGGGRGGGRCLVTAASTPRPGDALRPALPATLCLIHLGRSWQRDML